MQETKICPVCEKEKPVDEFAVCRNKNVNTPCGEYFMRIYKKIDEDDDI